MRTTSFLIATIAVGLAPFVREIAAQGVSPKATLVAAGVTGCTALPPRPSTARTAAATAEEIQRIVAEAQEAALQGEHLIARDAFSRAAQLDPRDSRIAYYLGREQEALGDQRAAVAEYCRYLALLPNAPDTEEVRGRIVRLTPSSELARIEQAKANFVTAVALLQRRQYAVADSVFGVVATEVPTAPEPHFNRALARAAQGSRVDAMESFERYLALDPAADDRLQVRALMSRLPDQVYRPGSSFASGMAVPGLGQMNTGRPVLGVTILGLAAGASVFALRTKTETVAQSFTDPFGNRYTDSVATTSRPYLIAGVASAAAVWLGGALESLMFARRSRARAQGVIVPEGVDRRVSLRVIPLRADRTAFALSASW